jgi:hypothetical protein
MGLCAKREYRNLFIGPEKAKECIVIYPEVVSGNPLGSEHVIRWCLFHPGMLEKSIGDDGEDILGKNDIVIFFSEQFKTDEMVDECLLILDANIPSEIPDLERRGSVFTVRKNKKIPKIPETKYLLELDEHWPVTIKEYIDVFSG